MNSAILRNSIILFSVLALFFTGCSTSSGSLISDVVAAASEKEEKKESKETSGGKTEKSEESSGKKETLEVEEFEELEDETGIYLESEPDGADVYINGFYQGTTPLHIEYLDAGSYELTIEKKGYAADSRWIDYDGETYTEFFFFLQELTGFIDVEFDPPDAEVLIDGKTAHMGINEIPVGPRIVKVRSFGFESAAYTVTVPEDQTIFLEGVLEEAAFRVEKARVSRKVLNPKNPGLLGRTTISFEVSSWGSGAVTILNEQDEEVFLHQFSDFRTWIQSVEWNGRDMDNTLLPDGTYRAVIEAQSEDGTVQQSADVSITLDSTRIIAYRSTWSGASGMLFTPTADVLPAGSLQLGASFLGHYETGTGDSVSLFPVQASLRVSPVRNLEVSVQAAITPMGTGTTPISVGAGLKYKIVNHPVIGIAPVLTGTYASGTTTDLFTNYQGVHLGIPVQLHAGPVSFTLTPELAVSPDRVVYSQTAVYPDAVLYVWPYARAGIHLQLSPFTFGISGVMRFTPFSESFAVDWPMAAGAEASWVLPESRFALLLQGSGEFSAASGFYLMLGVGFALLD